MTPEKLVSNLLDQAEVDALKAKFGLEDDDKSVFLRYRDQEGVERSYHWAKLRGFVRKDPKTGAMLDMVADIERTKKELIEQGHTILSG